MQDDRTLERALNEVARAQGMQYRELLQRRNFRLRWMVARLWHALHTAQHIDMVEQFERDEPNFFAAAQAIHAEQMEIAMEQVAADDLTSVVDDMLARIEGEGGGDLSPQPPLRSGEGEDGRADRLADRVIALRVALTAIATEPEVSAQEIALVALRDDLRAANHLGTAPGEGAGATTDTADGGEGGRGARTTEGETE